jgi:GAF domain-containing protein
VLNNIVKHAAQVLDSSSAWLYLLGQNPDEFRCEVSFGGNGDTGSHVLPSGKGLLGEIVQQATALIIPDFQTWPGEIAPIDPEKYQTVMGAPVVSEGNIKGVLILSRQSDSSPFTSNDLELLEIFANQVSTALETETLGKSKRYRRDVLAALHEASIRLTSSLELQSVLDEILDQALKLTAADDAHIFIFDVGRLSFGAARWADERKTEPYSEPREDGITYTVAQTGERIVTADVNKHPLFKEWMWGGAIASFPLRIDEQVVGVMNIAFEKPHVFEEG